VFVHVPVHNQEKMKTTYQNHKADKGKRE